MNLRARDAVMRRLTLLFVSVSVVWACADRTPVPQSVGPGQVEGIPAPDSSLTDSSPDADFFQYGDSLRFASDTPGVITQSRVVDGVTAELRLRSELRLPRTDSAAYARGRIIAKFETIGGTSAYGTPVGNAYLWVVDTGGGHLRGTLIWRNYLTGASGRTDVPYYIHSLPRTFRTDIPTGEDFSSSGLDTVRNCFICGDGRWNCPMTHDMSMARLDSLLEARGR